MKNIILNNYISLVLLVFATLFSFQLLPIANAQTDENFLVSWKASNYVPAGFAGKTIPLMQGTSINVAFEIAQDGTVLNLKNRFIKIFVNNKKQTEGVGAQRMSFSTNGISRTYNVRIVVLDGSDNLGQVDYEHSFVIPAVISPEVVLTSPEPHNRVFAGRYLIHALPYFFNITKITDLSFAWNVNGETPSAIELSNPERLELEIPTGYPNGFGISIDLNSQNTRQNSEAATTLFTLTKQ